MAKARTHQTDVGGFPEYSPAGGIRLPFQEAATSECRRFWAVLTQGNLLDRASTLIVSSCTKGSNKSLGERHARIISDRPAFLQRGGQELAHGRPRPVSPAQVRLPGCSSLLPRRQPTFATLTFHPPFRLFGTSRGPPARFAAHATVEKPF